MPKSRALRLACAVALLAPAAHAQDAGFVSFHTAGNAVLCALSWQRQDGWLRCDVYAAKADPALRPADCDADWGKFFTLNASGAAFRSCEGDMVWDPATSTEILPGQQVVHGPFVCRNEGGALSCTNAEYHGLTLSADHQNLN